MPTAPTAGRRRFSGFNRPPGGEARTIPMPDQKNLVVAIVLSLVILLGFQYFYELPRMRAQQEAQQAQQAVQQAQQQAQQAARPGAPATGAPTVPGQTADPSASANVDRAAIIAPSPPARIPPARDFMITLTSRDENSGGKPVTLPRYALIVRTGTPVTEGFYILHEGPVAVLNDVLREYDYSKVEKAKDGTIAESSTGGWLGITDKYWLVSLIPDAKEEIKARFVHTKPDNRDRYQADYLGASRQIPAGGSTTATHRVFAGAKEVQLLGRYRDELGIAKFDDAVDWGYFFFLTKPIFQ